MASIQEPKEKEKRLENLLREFEQWKKIVVKLNEMVIKLRAKIIEMEQDTSRTETTRQKLKVKVPVQIPHPQHYPAPCHRSLTPDYEYNEMRNKEMNLKYNQNLDK